MRILYRKNLLIMAKNSVGTNLFRNFFMDTTGLKQLDGTPYPAGETDIAENGRNSCAKFISSLLVLNELISHIHTLVPSTEKDMIASGWYKINQPKAGAIIVWSSLKGNDGQDHTHIGICTDGGLAISNDSRGIGVPIQHRIDCQGSTEGGRPIESIYWHDKLNN